jgi:hypothetical protein
MEGKLFDLVENTPRLNIEFCYHGLTDYTVRISEHSNAGEYLDVVSLDGCDRALVCALAYAKLVEYLNETRGGY